MDLLDPSIISYYLNSIKVKVLFQMTILIILIVLLELTKELQMSEKKQDEALNKIDSIINYKELYFQERDKRIELERQLENERIKLKRMNAINGNYKSRIRYCSNCSANLSSKKEIGNNDTSLIDQFKDFSEKMSSIKFPSSFGECLEPSLMSKIHIDNPNSKRHVGMIQNFAIFGMKERTIEDFILDSKLGNQFQGQILYSLKEKHDIEMQAAKFVFPSGMAIKKCQNHKAKQKTIELMSYCYTNLKSFILSFECPDESFDQHFHSNELLNHINPSRRLFCICIGIHDYTWIEHKNNKFNISLGNIQSGSNNSLPIYDEPLIKSQGHQILALSNKDSSKSIQDGDNVNDLEIGITQRVFCIMSYYPFFTFYEEILRNLINIVKMERLAIYKHNEENIKLTIKQTDTKFQMERMVELFDHCYKDLEFKKVNFNKQYELRLINQQKITLMSYWDDAKTFFIRDWIYSILSMFTFDTFLDVWTLMMLEDKLVFICDNSNILTHTIYLFTNVLTKPLQYPFPIVSIIPSLQDQEFLSAPMPIIYGILKKRKSIQDRNILQNFDMTYVFLAPEKVQIVCQQNRKTLLNYRSTKLNSSKQLKENFKDLKKTRKKQQKSSKYEIQSSEYCILASNQQKQRALKIISIITQFVTEDIVQRLPNHIQVQNMKKKIDEKLLNAQKDEHSYLMDAITSDIKKGTKDPFIAQFLNTQMVNNFVFK